MPTVARFSIAPVRSLGLAHPTEIDLTEVGVVEDRRFYLTDAVDRLVDRLVVPSLVQIGANTDPEATQLRLAFPDGTVIDEAVQLGIAGRDHRPQANGGRASRRRALGRRSVGVLRP